MKGRYNIYDLNTGATIASIVVEIPNIYKANPTYPDMCEIALAAYDCSLGTVTATVPHQRLEAAFIKYEETPLNLVKQWLKDEVEQDGGEGLVCYQFCIMRV